MIYEDEEGFVAGPGRGGTRFCGVGSGKEPVQKCPVCVLELPSPARLRSSSGWWTPIQTSNLANVHVAYGLEHVLCTDRETDRVQ